MNPEFFLILALLPTSVVPFKKSFNQMKYSLIMIKSIARAHLLVESLSVIMHELHLKFLNFCLYVFCEIIKLQTCTGLSPMNFDLL